MASSIKDNLQNCLEDALEQKNVHLIRDLLNEITHMTDNSDFLQLCEAPLKSCVTVNFKMHDLDTESSNLTKETIFSRSPKQNGISSLRHVKSKYKDACVVQNNIIVDGEDLDKDIGIFSLVLKPGYERVVFFLLQRCRHPIYNCDGESVLHIVAREKLSTLLDLLVYSKWLSGMMCCYNRDGYLPLHIAALSKFHRFFHLFYVELKEQTPIACLTRSLLDCQCGSYEAPETCQTSGMERSIQHTEACRNFVVGTCSSQVSFSCCGAVIDEKLIFDAQSKSIDINCKTHFQENSHSRHSHNTERETCLSLLWKKMLIRFDLVQNLSEVFYMCQALIRAGARGSLPRRKFNERVYRTYFDLSPLHVTAGMGSLENTKLLLSNGVDPGASLGRDCKLAVQLALQNGHNRVSLALLNSKLFNSSDSWICHVDRSGNTLFHCAVAAPYRCNIKVLEQLYKLGCPLDLPNSENMRPLDLAICSSHFPTIHYMLETKPELVNVQLYQDSRAYPPLLRASASPSSSLALCKLLLSHGADINACGYRKDHVTACYRAFKFACFETGFFLCENSSRPFSSTERRYLWVQLKTLKPSKLDRLEERLRNVPKLFLTCLDVIRRVFINKYFCFQKMDLLPLPHSLIKALRYEI